MENSESVLFKRICRACMKKNKTFTGMREQYAGIGISIYEMFNRTTPQLSRQPDKLEADNELPELICSGCLNLLSKTYGFQQMCIGSDTRMRDILREHKQQITNKQKELQLDEADLSVKEHSSSTLLGNVEPVLACNGIELQQVLEEGDMQPKSEQEEFSYADAKPITEIGEIEDVFIAEEEAHFIYSDAESTKDTIEVSAFNVETKQQAVTVLKPAIKTTLRRGRSKAYVNPGNTATQHNTESLSIEAKQITTTTTTRCKHICHECDKIFDCPSRLHKHMTRHTRAANNFECNLCKCRFISQHQLNCHKATHQKSIAELQKNLPAQYDFKCSECPRRFAKQGALSKHLLAHRTTTEPRGSTTKKDFECELCTKKFAKLSLLKGHQRRHKTNPNYKCTECEKTFLIKSHLIGHLNVHKGLEPFECDICHKVWTDGHSLMKHKLLHNDNKKYLCPTCGKAFKSSSNMLQHSLRHSNERRYQCPECPCRFTCQSDQIKHMAVHIKIKTYVCDTCGASFNRSDSMNKHKRIHSGQRPHKCEECNMSFVFIDHMRRHMRSHTGEKPFKCKYCDRAYAESGDLTKHLRTHVGENTYMCPECPAAFKYRAELRVHSNLHYLENPTAAAEATKTTTTTAT